jgi:Skp family chaperone for outer membrane proteins
MLKIFSNLFLIVFAFGALSINAAKAETPIAVIDLVKIIEKSEAGKDLQSKFKAKKEAVQKEATVYEKDLKSKEKTLLKDSKSLDKKAFEEKKAGFEKDLLKKREEVLKKNASLEKSKNEALKSIQAKVAQICADIAEAKKIQVILDRSAVVIAQQSLDLTADVIKKLDESMKSVTLK